MKRIRLIFFLAVCHLITALCLTLSSCSPAVPRLTAREDCRVLLSESGYYTCREDKKTVHPGDSVEFTLVFNRGYTFGDASYGNYSVDVAPPDEYGRRTAVLTLNDVRYPTYVSIDVREAAAAVYSVTLASSPLFRCEEPVRAVEEGGDAVFTLWFGADYTFGSADYPGSYVAAGADGGTNEKGERRVSLTIKNVLADTEIAVRAAEALPDEGEIRLEPVQSHAVIGYALNGGSYTSGENSGRYYTVNYSLQHHYRPNTSIGTDTIYRDGYVLTGWNTAEDGSGEHLGLGSRASVEAGDAELLYAEWAQWTDTSQFKYVIIDSTDIESLYTSASKDKLQMLKELAAECNSEDRSAVITAYRGTYAGKLVIPESLGGYPVAAVAPEAAAGHSEITEVVFPPSMKYVMESAFADCPGLTEVYLYDNMSYIGTNAFGINDHVETLHINAKTMPIYGAEENGQLANKIEMLMKAGEAKKTVFFGSCSLWYGVNAAEFTEATGEPAFNMGIIGGTCALYQLDLIRQYMRPGDTLIYMAEAGSPYQLLYNVDFDLRVFTTVENDYDMLASLNLQRYDKVFEALNEFFSAKNLQLAEGKTGSYEDYFPYMNEYGDMLKKRPGGYDNSKPRYGFIPEHVLLTENAFGKTEDLLRSYDEMGVRVYYTFGPLNKDGLDQEEISALNELFISQFEQRRIPVTMVGNLHSSILPSQYFFDTNYHLSTEGAQFFTQLFISNYRSNLRYFG